MPRKGQAAPPIARTIIEKYAYKPDLFLKDVFGVELWSKQREIIYSVFQNRKTVVPSGHGVGKTFTAACAVLAFLYLRSPCKVVTTAPTWAQVSNLLWSEIAALWGAAGGAKNLPGEILKTRLQIQPDWFAIGLSTNDATNIQGYHHEHVLCVLDEAPGVGEDIDRAVDSLTSTGDAHVLKIGNPIASAGHFFQAYMSPEWNTIQINCEDSPNLTDEVVSDKIARRLVTRAWVEEKAREWRKGSLLYMTKVQGAFPEIGTNTVIPRNWIEMAMDREPRTDQRDRPKHMGVDVAWEGDDSSIIMVREGDAMRIHRTSTSMDPIQLSGMVYKDCADIGITICSIDCVGIGAGTYAYLLGQKRSGQMPKTRVFGVNGKHTSTVLDQNDKPIYANKRSENWWRMRDALDPAKSPTLCLPKDDQLLQDLAEPLYFINNSGQIQVESKGELKDQSRLGRSPDRGDAAIYCLACDHYEQIRPLLTMAYENRSGGGPDDIGRAVDDVYAGTIFNAPEQNRPTIPSTFGSIRRMKG